MVLLAQKVFKLLINSQVVKNERVPYSALNSNNSHLEKYTVFRVGPDIWGLQNGAKGPKYFFKKGYFEHNTGPQKPDVKEFFQY